MLPYSLKDKFNSFKSKFKNPFAKKTGYFTSKNVKALKKYQKENPKAVMTNLGLNKRRFKIPSRKSRMNLTWSEERVLSQLEPGKVKKAFVKGLEDKYYGKKEEAA